MMERESSNFKKIIFGSLITLFSLLILISMVSSQENIYSDYNQIIKAHLNFLQVIKLDFPKVDNPIGVFGAVSSYLMIKILGRFFSIIFLMGIILLSINIFIINLDKRRIAKIICFLFWGLFLNILFLQFKIANSGTFPKFLNEALNHVFNPTGTKIIASFFTVILMTVSFELNKVINYFARKKSEKKLVKKEKKNKISKEKKKFLELTKKSDVDEKISEQVKNIPLKIRKHNKQQAEISDKKRFDFSEDRTFEEYTKPDIESFLFNQSKSNNENQKDLEKYINQIGKLLLAKLFEFDIDAKIENVNVGPIITQFEIEPPPGIKVSKFSNLADDIGLALKAKSIRIEAPIPGRGLIGVEVPNKYWDTIFLKDVMMSEEMGKFKDKPLTIALGKSISGKPIVANLAKMPHLLIAGATGAGKSVCINTLITSILLRATPDEVRLVLIDPKRIELSGYNGIPHLVQEVISDPEESLVAFNWAVKEMERRYSLLQNYKVRDIVSFNKKIETLQKEDKDFEEKKIPYIVIVVDEFADLIMTAGRDIEMPISRLAQMARAIGIHLIIATQRPSTKVITGIIKANFPTRIAFKVSSKIDSRVILDSNGAEQLLGRGDMLFLGPGKATVERIHGAFVTDGEIESIVEYLKLQPKSEVDVKIEIKTEPDLENFDYDDELFPEAARTIVSAQTASVSMLQRHFKIGYARAGRLVDSLEKAGIIGPHVGSKSRDVLITEEDLKKYGF